jgi:hypothetical protein
MQATLTLFKSLTNFTLEEFDKLTFQVVLMIKAHARSIGEILFFIFIFGFRLGLIFKCKVKVKG